jgi:hypothetical protein
MAGTRPRHIRRISAAAVHDFEGSPRRACSLKRLRAAVFDIALRPSRVILIIVARVFFVTLARGCRPKGPGSGIPRAPATQTRGNDKQEDLQPIQSVVRHSQSSVIDQRIAIGIRPLDSLNLSDLPRTTLAAQLPYDFDLMIPAHDVAF